MAISFTCRLIWRDGSEWQLTVVWQDRRGISVTGIGCYQAFYTSEAELRQKLPALDRIAQGLGPNWLAAIGNGGKVVWNQGKPDQILLNGRPWALRTAPESVPMQGTLWQ